MKVPVVMTNCATILCIVFVLIFDSMLYGLEHHLSAGNFNVADFGAEQDGKTPATGPIQKAIDSCYEQGGGTVYFPPGVYLSGSLHLKSGVALYLDHGATILASPDDNDFDPYEELGFENDSDRETSFFHHALIWGEDIERIAISGTGTINGNRNKRGGPKPIALKRCKFVSIKDITIVNAPNYAISMLGTDYVNIDGVSILNGYCDGIDPDGCRNVRISNCYIDSYDDAIVPKASFSLGERRSVENLTVTNCILATNCNAFKLGTESGGDFKYITFSNSVLKNRDVGRPPISGIALESVDGANIDGVAISNVSMINVRAPIFLRLGNRGRDMDTPVPGTLRNVLINNIVATGAQLTCGILGIPQHPIQDVSLQNIRITFAGGGTLDQADIEVPELESVYPEITKFGTLPAFGLYCRHVQGLRLQNVKLSWESPDQRHALFFDDVANLEIAALEAPQAEAAASVMHFNKVFQALIHGCMPSAATNRYITVTDTQCEDVMLAANNLTNVVEVCGQK